MRSRLCLATCLWSGFFLLCLLQPGSLRIIGTLAFAAPAPASAQRPAWTRDGIVAWSAMEPVVFYRRRGGAPVDIEERRKADLSEAHVRKLKEAGINLAIVSFYKGAGLEAEAEDMARTKTFVEIAHRNGVKVGGYVGASMLGETLFLEEPAARDWKQVDEWGRPVYYTSDQTFRYMACRNNPGYREHIRKVLRIGVQELKLDLFHFDQLRWHGEPASCRCKYCEAEFRAFLNRKYNEPQRKLRFGFVRMDAVIPPAYNVEGSPIRLTELRNPLMQEWAYFRAANLAQRYGEIVDFIRSLNPEVAVQGNPTMTPSVNAGFTYGVDVSQLLAHGDFIWCEEGNNPEWTADGRLVSRIRTFKVTRLMDKPLFNWQAALPPDVWKQPALLRLAEPLAYNDMNLGSFRSLSEMTPEVRRYVSFFHAHARDLRDTTPLADVAVLRSFPSVEFNPAKGLFSTVLFEQVLIQAKVPFDIICDRHLKDLSRYKVLILANQDALSDEQLETIRQFVKSGGGLVATEEIASLTDWRLERTRPGLADLLGHAAESGDRQSPFQRPFGKGRVAYFPRIEYAVPAPPAQMNYSVGNHYWKLPKNSAAMVSAVRWAAGQQLSASVQAPEWVTAELALQRNTNTMLVHLVNFKVQTPVEDIQVGLRTPPGMRVREAAVESPDVAGRQVLEVTTTNHIAAFRVPLLKVYDLVTLRMEKEPPAR